jgi:hypothetical protein
VLSHDSLNLPSPPIINEECQPVVVHYFTGKMPKPFGHIAIQFGKYYVSYNSGDSIKNEVEYDSVNLFIQLNKLTYGGSHVAIPLPMTPSIIDLADIITKWQKDWAPANYSFLSKNCAHSVLWCGHLIGFVGKESLTKFGLRPHNVAKEFLALAKKQNTYERELILNDQKSNPHERFNKLIQNDIDKSQLQISDNTINSTSETISPTQDHILKLMDFRESLSTSAPKQIKKHIYSNPALGEEYKHEALLELSLMEYKDSSSRYYGDMNKLRDIRIAGLINFRILKLLSLLCGKNGDFAKILLAGAVKSHRKIMEESSKELHYSSDRHDDLFLLFDLFVYLSQQCEKLLLFSEAVDKIELSAEKTRELTANFDTLMTVLEKMSAGVQAYAMDGQVNKIKAIILESASFCSEFLTFSQNIIPASEGSVVSFTHDSFSVAQQNPAWLEWLIFQIENILFWHTQTYPDAVDRHMHLRDMLISLNANKHEYQLGLKTSRQVFHEACDNLLVAPWGQAVQAYDSKSPNNYQAFISYLNSNKAKAYDDALIREMADIWRTYTRVRADDYPTNVKMFSELMIPWRVSDAIYGSNQAASAALIELTISIAKLEDNYISRRLKEVEKKLDYFVKHKIMDSWMMLVKLTEEVNRAVLFLQSKNSLFARTLQPLLVKAKMTLSQYAIPEFKTGSVDTCAGIVAAYCDDDKVLEDVKLNLRR